MTPFPRTVFRPAFGDTAIFSETRLPDDVTQAVVELAPNSGTELHYHADRVEVVEVLLGVLTVQLGEHIFRLRPGDAATIPAGSHHRYCNESADKAVSIRCLIRKAVPVSVSNMAKDKALA